MVGGPADVFDAVRPCFDAMGTTVVRQGDHGAGQHTKLVNQILIASTMVAMSEGLLYSARVGLDVEQVLPSVTNGAAGSWSLSNLAPRVVAGDFAPGFLVDHLVKDLGIALAEAKRARLALPGLALANQLTSRSRPKTTDATGRRRSCNVLGVALGLDMASLAELKISAWDRPRNSRGAAPPWLRTRSRCLPVWCGRRWPAGGRRP